jgi:hypothetical protein
MRVGRPAGRPVFGSILLAGLPYLMLLGCVGVVASIVVAFEEPDTRMLLISGLFVVAAPVGMALHLAFTDELNPEDKRAWIAGLASFKDLGLFGAYFTPTRRRQATERLRARGQGAERGDR